MHGITIWLQYKFGGSCEETPTHGNTSLDGKCGFMENNYIGCSSTPKDNMVGTSKQYDDVKDQANGESMSSKIDGHMGHKWEII